MSRAREETHRDDEYVMKFFEACREFIEFVKNFEKFDPSAMDKLRYLHYTDYTILRHPYATLYLVEPETMSSLGQLVFNVENGDVISVRIRCRHGWLYKGFGTALSREQVPFAQQTWYHITSTTTRSIAVEKEIEDRVNEVIKELKPLLIKYLRNVTNII